MKTRLAVTAVVATMALTGQMFLASPALADDEKKASHSLFFTGSTPPDTHLVCGTTKKNKPYTLHISGTASGSDGQFIIFFRDGDAMGFNVPMGSTYSTSHALGGVPNVDTPTVMIGQEGGVNSMMASVLTHDGKAFCTHCTGGRSGATGTAGPGDPPQCNFP
ncbi:MAG: hypothetical protein HYY12_05505 [Candidatus Methylomirabilis oxyfera]|nr:hypothetical protein [Candidatus Methylomirabilis oxyfera]